jgi:GT2 family glycosyltransferase
MIKKLLANLRFIFKIIFDGNVRKKFQDLMFTSIFSMFSGVQAATLFKILTDRYGTRGKPLINSSNQYSIWLKTNEFNKQMRKKSLDKISRFQYKPKISIILPIYDADKKYLKNTINSIIQQVYRNWELFLVSDTSTKKNIQKILHKYSQRYQNINTITQGGTQEQIMFDTVLSLIDGEFVGFLEKNDELTPDALFEIVKFLNIHPNTDYIYTDEDKKDSYDDRYDPFFKPDWSPYLFFSVNYLANFGVIRKSIMYQLTSSCKFENQRYDLILRLTEITNKIGHIPKPLYTKSKLSQITTLKDGKSNLLARNILKDALSRRGINTSVNDSGIEGVHKVSYKLENEPSISIIIPTRDNLDYLRRCIESIQKKTDYANYEIIIIDNGCQDEKTLEYLKSLPKVLRNVSEFNASKLHNLGASHASGKYLLLLNDDVEVIDGSWLTEMVSIAEQKDVGVVGAKLLFPDDTIQHGGVIIGLGGIAGHAFYRHDPKEPTYFNLLNIPRDCSAVTGACMLAKKSVYDKVEGFDEKFHRAFGDTDFCLRVIYEAQKRVVYTPYAVLTHHEGITRGKKRTPPISDIEHFKEKWKLLLAKGDPYYNPNLSLERSYEIARTRASMENLEEPLANLLEVYLQRNDLKTTYPEALNGNKKNLINWAYTHGIRTDSAKNILCNESDYYRNMATLIRLKNNLFKPPTQRTNIMVH